MRKYVAVFILMSAPLFSESLSDYKAAETQFYEAETLADIASFQNSSFAFEKALYYYKKGSVETNESAYRQSSELLETELSGTTNVYLLSYYGISKMGESMIAGLFGGGTALFREGKAALDKALSLYPAHYLPNIYCGMLYGFIPEISGGDSDLADECFSTGVSQLSESEFPDRFLAFSYAIYGVFLGEKQKEYEDAVYYLKLARGYLDETADLDDRIAKYEKKL